jgi:hypothetical protein
MMQESPMQFHPGAGRHQGNRVKAFAPVPQAFAPVSQAFAPCHRLSPPCHGRI